MDDNRIEKYTPDYTDILGQYESDIYNAIEKFCAGNNIDDLKKESQSVFNACLRYIGKSVFYDKDKLKDKSNIYNIYNKAIPYTNLNRYNYKLLDLLSDIYFNICYITNHEISIIGFSYFINIEYDTIHSWIDRKQDNKLTSDSFRLAEKIIKANEESLSNRLYSANGNVVGTITILNHKFNWATQTIEHVSKRRDVLSAAELPKLGQENRQNLQIDEKPDNI